MFIQAKTVQEMTDVINQVKSTTDRFQGILDNFTNASTRSIYILGARSCLGIIRTCLRELTVIQNVFNIRVSSLQEMNAEERDIYSGTWTRTLDKAIVSIDGSKTSVNMLSQMLPAHTTTSVRKELQEYVAEDQKPLIVAASHIHEMILSTKAS